MILVAQLPRRFERLAVLAQEVEVKASLSSPTYWRGHAHGLYLAAQDLRALLFTGTPPSLLAGLAQQWVQLALEAQLRANDQPAEQDFLAGLAEALSFSAAQLLEALTPGWEASGANGRTMQRPAAPSRPRYR